MTAVRDLDPLGDEDARIALDPQTAASLWRRLSLHAASLDVRDPRATHAEEALHAAGVRIRTLDPARFESEIVRIHTLSVESFRNNLLYSDIGLEEFAAMYRPIEAAIDPALCFFAEHGDRLVGYVFTLPDRAEERRTGTLRTAIVKMLARVLAERARCAIRGYTLFARSLG